MKKFKNIWRNISQKITETNGHFAGGPSLKEQMFFIKRFSFLIRAGVPVLDALHVLRGQSKAKSHARLIDTIIDDTSNGRALSRSFARFPDRFNEFAISIIRVGETTGMLSENLAYLADELKKQHALKRKVIGAFIYPAIVALATLCIVAFLMVYLFPKIMPIFTSLHVTLPLSTRIVMRLSTFLQNFGLILIGAIALLGIIVLFLNKKSILFRSLFHRALLTIPIVSTVVQEYHIANASRTLGTLLRTGMPLPQALPIAAETTPHLSYKYEWENLSRVALRGEELSTGLARRRDLFPDIFTHMVAVGEKSGTLAETFTYLSELYEGEVDEFTKNLSTLIEPALMVAMGMIIGFVAISIITPIYGITQSLHV
ncbi:type II secretion system F family protein [bacterium]|nr:type II secretion system F family protein [bacterium]